MDAVLHRSCSGSSLCRFATLIQRSCLSVLARSNLLPNQIRNSYSYRRIGNISAVRLLTVRRRFDCNTCINMRFCSRSCPNPEPSTSRMKNRAFEAVQEDLRGLTRNIKQALASENKAVQDVAEHYFDKEGKLFRPSIILLMSRLCNTSETQTKSMPNQYKIALVAEMIHTASLIHDDVIDEADSRRNRPSANFVWGNKKAILAGDYILAKATKVLASIGNPEVISILAQVIEDLVKGEFTQMDSVDRYSEEVLDRKRLFSVYLDKTYQKTASLFANSCKAAALLANCSKTTIAQAYSYGKHVGLAFQLIDDSLDFTGDSNVLGKPAAADVKLGIATAPVLYTLDNSEMRDMVRRHFSQPHDVARAVELVLEGDGIDRTRRLAEEHAQKAVASLETFPESVYKESLKDVAIQVVERQR